MAEASDIRALADRLRAEGRALSGDGFGHVGYLKSAYKKASKQLEEFAAALEVIPPEGEELEITNCNLKCMGVGIDNVPGCDCREIFEKVLGV